MTVDPATTAAPRRPRGPGLPLLLGRLPDQVRGRSGALPDQGSRRGAAGAGRDDLHLPHASGDPPGRARLLPDLRHGAGAGDGHGRRRSQPRAGRHDAAVLDRPGADACRCSSSRWAAISSDLHGADRAGQTSNWIQFALATPVVLWAGWPFFERGWASLQTRNLNMFTLIAHRGRRRLDSTASSRCWRPACSRRRSGAMDGSVAGLFRGRGGDHRAGAARPGAGAARARADLRRDPRAARTWRPRRRRRIARRRDRRGRRRSTRSQVGDRLRVRPGEKVPVDGVLAEGPGLDRRVDGDRRVHAGDQGRPATRWSAARSTRPAPSSCGPTRSAPTPCCRRSSRWSPRPSAAARRSSGWPTGSPAGSCRR